jgi:hypothetical protein
MGRDAFRRSDTDAVLGSAGPGAEAGTCVGGGDRPGPVATEVTVAAPYADRYTAYDVGQLPGIPLHSVAGAVVPSRDPSALIVGASMVLGQGPAALYSFALRRGPCGHIVGVDGAPTSLATTPGTINAVVEGPGGVVLAAHDAPGAESGLALPLLELDPVSRGTRSIALRDLLPSAGDHGLAIAGIGSCRRP